MLNLVIKKKKKKDMQASPYASRCRVEVVGGRGRRNQVPGASPRPLPKLLVWFPLSS